MDIRLRENLPAGVSHEQRLAVAQELATRVVTRHSSAVAAIAIRGSTAVGADGPYSNLDVIVVTYPDMSQESKCYSHAGMAIRLDYRTVEEAMGEARDPSAGGAWMTAQVLYDPQGVVEDLRRTWRGLSRNDCRRRFVRYMCEHLVTSIGKMRNAAIAGDRARFVHAACEFAHDVCRALCALNDKTHVADGRQLFRETMKLKVLPADFERLIGIVSGAWPAGDQEVYDAAEDLWAGMQRLAEQQGLVWVSGDLMI